MASAGTIASLYYSKLQFVFSSNKLNDFADDVRFDAIERERERIASELHDGLLNKLSIMQLNVAVGASVEEMNELISSVIEDTRRLSHGLMPPVSFGVSLAQLLESLLDQWEIKFLVIRDVCINHQYPYSDDQKMHVYRVFQEIITNVSKHTSSKKIHFTFYSSLTHTYISIKDFSENHIFESFSEGFGMSSIQKRAQKLNAIINWECNRVDGVKFTMVLPHVL